MDPRYEQLAELLIGYSCALAPGETIVIDAIDAPAVITRALVRAADRAGGLPVVMLHQQALWRDLMLVGSEEQMRRIGRWEASLMAEAQAYVGVRATANAAEHSDIPPEKLDLYRRHVWVPVHRDIRVPNTRWVILRWPSSAMAQAAGMSSEAFEDFYFDVCTLDYARMSRAAQPLLELMSATDRVRLVAPGTDLTFSIAGIPAVACDGHFNIPDGEVFTAPVKESVEGTVRFNTPTIYEGTPHDDVRLVFRQGRAVEATSSDTAHLETLLDTDDGARYLGEFAIGFHPLIRRPMLDILFDEKIAGSVHLTPGNAYEEAWNGNRSAIHWDLVLRMDPENGGGEIWFDDRLIRRDGRFVVAELEGLNPDRLLA